VTLTDALYALVVAILVLAFALPLVRAAATIFVPIGIVILLALFVIDQANGGPVTAILIDYLIRFFQGLYARIAELTRAS
jgi:hypothetical protein